MRKISVCIFCIMLLAACAPGDGCMQDLNMSMKATLYRMTYDNSIEQFTPEKYACQLSLCGLERDSMLYDSYTTSSLNIPLQKFDSVSSFVLSINGESQSDTIDVYHANETKFVSIDCGCIVKNQLKGISQTTHTIDSIIIESPVVDLGTGNNLKIYLKNK